MRLRSEAEPPDTNGAARTPYDKRGVLFDVDGVLRIDSGLPSILVAERIREAIVSGVKIGLATSNPTYDMYSIFDALGLRDDTITNTGATIVSPQTRRVVWQRTLMPEDIDRVRRVVAPKSIEIRNAFGHGTLTDSYNPPDPIGMYLYALYPQEAEEVAIELASLQTIAVHPIISDTPGRRDLDITHQQVSKGKTVPVLASRWGVEPHQIVAVGDGFGELDLFSACGYGVAMGNSVTELKRRADAHVGSVDNDGAIEVFDIVRFSV